MFTYRLLLTTYDLIISFPPPPVKGPSDKNTICILCKSMVYSLLPMEPIGSCAVVAQLDRALDSDSKGQRFESPRPHHRTPRRVKTAGCLSFCRLGAKIRRAVSHAAGLLYDPVKASGIQPLNSSASMVMSSNCGASPTKASMSVRSPRSSASQPAPFCRLRAASIRSVP